MDMEHVILEYSTMDMEHVILEYIVPYFRTKQQNRRSAQRQQGCTLQFADLQRAQVWPPKHHGRMMGNKNVQ